MMPVDLVKLPLVVYSAILVMFSVVEANRPDNTIDNIHLYSNLTNTIQNAIRTARAFNFGGIHSRHGFPFSFVTRDEDVEV